MLKRKRLALHGRKPGVNREIGIWAFVCAEHYEALLGCCGMRPEQAAATLLLVLLLYSYFNENSHSANQPIDSQDQVEKSSMIDRIISEDWR